MEQIQFSYYPWHEGNLLGEEIIQYRNTLLGIKESNPAIQVSAEFLTTDKGTHLLLVRIKGEAKDLETAVTTVFNQLRTPDEVYKPPLLLDIDRITDMILTCGLRPINKSTIYSTLATYNFARNLLKGKEVCFRRRITY